MPRKCSSQRFGLAWLCIFFRVMDWANFANEKKHVIIINLVTLPCFFSNFVDVTKLSLIWLYLLLSKYFYKFINPAIVKIFFNFELRRLVSLIRSSLLLKKQWKEHHYFYKHGYILFGTFSHMIIMTQKVDPLAEKGAGISIKESSFKVIDVWLD